MLDCDVAQPCEARLTWSLERGLTTTLRAPCEPGETLYLSMPSGMPEEAWCREDATSAATAYDLSRYEGLDVQGTLRDGVALHPPRVTLSLRLTSPDSPKPTTCRVLVNGEPVRQTGDGMYQAQVWGRTEAWAECDGLVGPPQVWVVRKDAEVGLSWRRQAPVLDLTQHRPDVRSVLLAQRSGRGHGWVMPLTRRDDGAWQLPPLREGIYKLGFDAPEAVVRHKASRPGMPKGRVFVEEAKWAEAREDGGTYGVLELDAPVDHGRLPVSWATEEYDFRTDVRPEDRP